MCCVRTSIAMTTSTVSSESRPRSLNIVSATTLPSSTWHAPARDAHARANVSRASSSRARARAPPTCLLVILDDHHDALHDVVLGQECLRARGARSSRLRVARITDSIAKLTSAANCRIWHATGMRTAHGYQSGCRSETSKQLACWRTELGVSS